MKALFKIIVKDNNGENLCISLDSDKALRTAELNLIKEGIPYELDSRSGYSLYGATDKQQADMLEAIRFWRS
mgnify:CR=1 FL=1